ncbi:unnamed protein product [Soboliphyme baturini]|uniref:Bromodomain adjacent to zinc finger domain protein 1A n=1 Tax=Soboliphyme baturini TaxID=241478 RepID=A0A183IDW1_9BILA|nr:unnamed protein product [Soboliphyme baturini]
MIDLTECFVLVCYSIKRNPEFAARYMVRIAVGEEESASCGESKSYSVIDVSAANVARRKTPFTKQKCRVFLRGHCEIVSGIWSVKVRWKFSNNMEYCMVTPFLKKSSLDEYSIYDLNWRNIHAGPLPRFVLSYNVKEESPSDSGSSSGSGDDEALPSRKKLCGDKQRQSINILLEEARKYDIDVDDRLLEKLYSSNSASDDDDLCNIKEQIKKAKDEEKERLRSLKRQEREALVEWKKPRDDLLCDDHAPFPPLPYVVLPPSIGAEGFGDCLSLVEFTNSFALSLELEDYFPDGPFTVSALYEALFDCDVNGPFSKLCMMFLQHIFLLQEQEDGDEVELERKEDAQLENCELDNKYFRKYIEQATRLSQKTRKIHGVSVRNLPLNSFTLSEVFRLYFKTSGYYTGANTARFRYHSRGGYKCIDDQALFFRIDHENLVERLSSDCIYQFSPEERLLVLLALRDHLLTFSLDKIRSLRADLRQSQLTEQRNEREAFVAKMAIADKASTIDRTSAAEASSNMNTVTAVNSPSAATRKLKESLRALVEASEDSTTEGVQIDYEMLECVNFDQLDMSEIELVRKLQEKHAMLEESNMVAEIFELQDASGMILLGTDRAFRRYWLIKSAGTVFVEENQNDQTMDECECPTPLDKVTAVDISNVTRAQRELLVCSGMKASCAVHGTHGRHQWSFVADESQLQALLDVLNRRGIREAELFDNISFFRGVLSPLLQQFDAQPFLETTHLSSSVMNTVSVSVLEEHLRQDLLELEERIFSNGLGILKTPSRTSWRSAVLKCSRVTDLKNRADANNLMTDGKLVRVENFFVMALYQLASCIHERNFKEVATEEVAKSASVGDDNKGFLDLWKNSLLCVSSISAIQLHLMTLDEQIAWKKSLSNARCRICRRKGTAPSFVVCANCEKPFHAKCVRPSIRGRQPTMSPDWLCSTCSYHDGGKQVDDDINDNDTDCGRLALNGANCLEVNFDHSLQLKAENDCFNADVESSTENSNDGLVCRVCQQLVINDKSGTACSSCGTAFHLRCLGLKKAGAPGQQWLCSVCSEDGLSNVYHKDDEKTDRKCLKTSRSGRIIKKPRSLGEFENRFNGVFKKETLSRSVEKRKSLPATHQNGDLYVSEWPTKGRSAKRSQYASEPTADERCQELIRLLSCHRDSWPFLKPVSKRIAPDYYDIIKCPMDLRTVQYKLDKHSYISVDELLADVTLMFDNCRTYNDPSAVVFQCGDRLEQYFRTKITDLHLGDEEPPLFHKRRRSTAPVS